MKHFIVSMLLVVVYLAVCSCHRPTPRRQTKFRKFICEEIASIKEENEKITSALEKEIDDLRLHLSLAGYKSAFAIYNKEPIGTGADVIMRVPPEGVITNEGGHYNNATGVYTAPYTGLYGFVLSIYKEYGENDSVSCRIYRNDDDDSVAVANTINESGYRGASGATLLQLDEGDTVFVQCSSVENLDGWTSYIGFLLKAD